MFFNLQVNVFNIYDVYVCLSIRAKSEEKNY